MKRVKRFFFTPMTLAYWKAMLGDRRNGFTDRRLKGLHISVNTRRGV